MKTLVVLFCGAPVTHAFDSVFDGSSAFDRSLDWASSVKESAGTVILCRPETEAAAQKAAALHKNAAAVSVVTQTDWTAALLAHTLAEQAASAKAACVTYAWADCPFLDGALTQTALDTHEKYISEYTFSDGYPYGFAPEIIDAGALNLIAALASGTQTAAGNMPVNHDSLFSIMKGDVNSFEIETIIAPKDFRLYRLDFSCGTKRSLLACEALFAKGKSLLTQAGGAEKAAGRTGDESLPEAGDHALALSELAVTLPEVLQTVPSFYSIQITGRCSGHCISCPYPKAFAEKYHASPDAADSGCKDMPLAGYKTLLAQIAGLSESAMIALSAWGEPLEHPQFPDFVAAALENPALSILVETEGTAVTEALAEKIAGIVKSAPERTNGNPPVIWIVSLDAVSSAVYGRMHGVSVTDQAQALFNAAVQSVSLLQKYFAGCVYPQLMRTNVSEAELEAFYRYWSSKDSPSGGNIIIQKYDTFCGLLPDCKPADLSPLERNPCWHLRRDMTILADGSVPLCREYMLDGAEGNVFTGTLESVWLKSRDVLAQQLAHSYSKKCEKCDEYYTFNF